MTTDERLAALYGTLRSIGLPALVMGGQAVRFYGIDRSTLGYDLHVLLEDAEWTGIASMLAATPLLAPAGVIEGPSWRPAEFTRFVIGTLPDDHALVEAVRRLYRSHAVALDRADKERAARSAD